MNSVYVDTNIFLYLSDKESPFHQTVISLVNYLKADKTNILTSVETVQEIIHFSQNIKQLTGGLEAVKKTFEIIDGILVIDKEVINVYLDLVKKHKNIKSRDSLHVATCLKNQVNYLISYDKDFKKFREINSMTPAEFLKLKL